MSSALDFIRRLGWSVVDFIYSLIDTIFNILKELNLYNIVESVAENTIFSNFHSGIIAIAITVLALFVVWRFVMKILDSDEGLSINQIVMEIVKCSLLVILSVFMFTEANNFSIKLSGYAGSLFSNNNVTISDEMLNMYISHSEAYIKSDEFKNENITENIKNENFSNKRMYNDKFVTSEKWIMPDEEEYKYNINWILAIIVGGFFLYALFFSGMMLARRQIEFLFLFLISPIVFATSIGNKQRRSAVIEQLVSLIFQASVVMIIISITVLVMMAINNTTFFEDSIFQDMALKSLMFVGCGTFLITGSQVINRFIGANVSANSGREQMMSLMSYTNTFTSATNVASNTITGAGAYGLGVATSLAGKAGGNALVGKVGGAIQNFGHKLSSGGNNSYFKSAVGSKIENFGSKMRTQTPSNIGKGMRSYGKDNISNVFNSVMPQRNMYRSRYRRRE